MPLYYFHLHDGDRWLIDEEGLDLGGIDEVASVALLQARDILAGDLRDGRLGLQNHIEVADADGLLVHALRFAEAVVIDWPMGDLEPPSPTMVGFGGRTPV